MEKEYIEREKINDYISKLREYVSASVGLSQAEYSFISDILTALENFTAADVAPVKHGHWKVSWDRFDNYASGHDYEFSECECNVLCSNCHFVTRIPWEKQQDKKSFIQIHQVAMLRNAKTNYCPNCGAKMDGGEENG